MLEAMKKFSVNSCFGGKAVFFLLLLFPLFKGCLLPADIEERSSQASMNPDETGYLLGIENPYPPEGVLVLPADCPLARFRILLKETPEKGDTINETLEIRWFLDYEENPNVVCLGDKITGLVCTLSPNQLSKNETHLLEAVVSDLGFQSGDETPINRAAIEGANIEAARWLLRLDDALDAETHEFCR